MTYQGIDTAARINVAQARKMRENGVCFVGRYLVPSGYKAITAQEISDLRQAGLAILLCWELSANAVRNGAGQGQYDGERARKLAEAFGVPQGTTIFFAADYDVPQSDLIYAEQYILAAQSALGKYVAGIYGGERVCEFLSTRGSCRKVWQCVAWTSTFIEAANVRQYAWQGDSRSKAMAAACGIAAVDLDATEDMKGAGLWLPFNEYEDGDGVIIETPKPKPWYQDTVEWAQKEGIVTEARPTDCATRAEVMQMIRNYNKRFEDADSKTNSGLLTE